MSEEITNENLIPEKDRDFLHEKGFTFIIVPEKGSLLLIIKNFPFSKIYNPTQADLLIVLPAGYPNSNLDMFWTYPDVKLSNGSWPAAADQHGQYSGLTWQRWSRHGNWRPGIDSLKNFMASISKEINRGV